MWESDVRWQLFLIPEFQYFLKIIISFRKKIRFWETKIGNFSTVEPRSTDTHLIRKPAVDNGQFRLSRHWKISYDFLWKVTRLLETQTQWHVPFNVCLRVPINCLVLELDHYNNNSYEREILAMTIRRFAFLSFIWGIPMQQKPKIKKLLYL